MVDVAVEGELGVADVAVLGRYGDPRELLRAGRLRVVALITKASRGQHGEERADAWRAVAAAALELYGDDRHHPSRWLANDQGVERCRLLTGQASIGPHTCTRVPLAAAPRSRWNNAWRASRTAIPTTQRTR